MRRILFLLPLLALALPAGAGGDKFDPEARAKALAPYIDELTIAVARVDLSRPDAEAVATKIAEMAGALEEGDAAKRPLRRWLADFTGAGGKELFFLFSFADNSGPAVVAPLAEGADAKAIAKLLGSGKLLPAGEYAKVGKAVVGGSKETRERLKHLKPDPRPELAKAFVAAGDTTAQLLVLPTADNRRVIEELMPTLPKEIGGGPSMVLTRGVLWGAAGLSGPPKSSLQIVVQSQNAAGARGLRDWLGKALQAFGESKEVQHLFPNFEKIAAAIKPEVAGDRLTVTLEEQQVAALLQPLARVQRQASTLQQSLKNLKQLALAVWNYYDARNNRFPAWASRDKQGKPLLSWRVHLLPYLEQLQLHQQFKLDEPWDSEHNKKLIAKMPKIYLSPFQKKGQAGKTTYLAPRGKETMWPDQGGLQAKDVTDGTSNTIQLVEVIPERAVIWTRPDDLQVDLKKPHEGLVAKGRDRFPVALVDGSVRTVPAKVSAATLRAAFTRGGGEVLGADW